MTMLVDGSLRSGWQLALKHIIPVQTLTKTVETTMNRSQAAELLSQAEFDSSSSVQLSADIAWKDNL